MNRIMEGHWQQLKGKMKTHWDKITVDHSSTIDGKRVSIEGQVQEISTNDEYLIKDEILSRRAVLRGALVVGCGLWMPITFSGCDANKGSNANNPAPANSTSTSTDSTAPASASKAPQASVQYQTQPKGEQKCNECMHFIAESNSCKLVEGEISPDGWCSLWTMRA